MSDETQFWCNACLMDVPLEQTKVIDIRTCEGERLFFAQTVHTLCGTPLGEKNAEIRVTGLKPPKVSDSDREIAASLNSVVNANFVSWHKALDEELKDVVRRAIKLVEENPRNEPMRTEIARPAVESMLIQDLDRSQLGHSTLTDAGWRPTIDRIAR